jgi:hypothetical protein
MGIEDEKRIMFEIYRETTDNGRFRVVYFTELGERERETEISNAVRGDHVFDGFILSRERWGAKQVMEKILDRLNNGGSLDLRTIEDELRPFMAY